MVLNQQNVKIMYGPQTSAYETAGTRTTVLGRVQSFSASPTENLIYDYGVGEGFNSVSTLLSTMDVTGNVQFNPTADGLDFLKHWIGVKSGAGTSGDPYTLTEDDVVGLTSSDIQVFTLEVANDTESTDSVDLYVGCVGTDFTITGEIGQKVVIDANFVARHPQYGTTATSYSTVTTPAFIVVGGTYSFGSSPTSLSGVRSFSWTYTGNYSPGDDRALDSRFISIPVLKQRQYDWSLTMSMSQAIASTWKTYFFGASGQPLDGSTTSTPTADLEFKIELTNGSENALFWLDQCNVLTMSEPISVGGGRVILTVNGRSRLGRSNAPISYWTA